MNNLAWGKVRGSELLHHSSLGKVMLMVLVMTKACKGLGLGFVKQGCSR
jgi:hypothetical protein